MLNTSAESNSSHRTFSPLLDEWNDAYGAEISKLSENRQALYKARLTRRKQNETTFKIEFDCDTQDFQDTAVRKIAELVGQSDVSSIYCFKVILNSLYGYFSTHSHRCFLSDCPSCKQAAANFLNQIYLEEFSKTCIEPAQAKNGKTEQAFRQREVLALLILHKFRFFPQPMDKLRVSEPLRFLYFYAGSERLRSFLDTTFTDEFFVDLPFYVAFIYDDLGFMCPDDIEPYRSYNGGEDVTAYEISFSKENGLANRLDEFISSLNVDEDEKRSEKLPMAIASTSKEQSARTLKAKRSVFLETPVKNRKQADDDPNHEGQKIIYQTPISKIKRISISNNKNLDYWPGIGADNSSTAPVNRKRPNNLAQDSIHTKKQKITGDSVQPSCYNLSILFANFQ